MFCCAFWKELLGLKFEHNTNWYPAREPSKEKDIVSQASVRMKQYQAARLQAEKLGGLGQGAKPLQHANGMLAHATC